MSNQAYITGDLQIRNLSGALTATSGVVGSIAIGVANGLATLGSDGKVPTTQLPTLGSSYKGAWNASTNTPTIADGTGVNGDYYLVSVGGTQNLGSGSIVFAEGNTVIYNGTIWQKAGSASGTVTSVGLTAPAAFSVTGSPITSTGTIAITAAGTSAQYIKGDGTLGTLNTSVVPEGSNLYFTNARTIASTLTSYVSGAGAITSGDSILSAIQKLNGNVSALTTGVSSVFGRTGAVTATSGDYTTSQVTEGTNLYYTAARFNTAFSGKSTTDLAEGSNLYFTNTRGISSTLTGYISGSGTVSSTDTILSSIQKLNGNISGLVTGVSSVYGRTGAVVATSGDYSTSLVTEGSNLYYTQARFDSAFSAKSTSNLTEGSNLYFTNTRARAALSATGPLAYNSSTGAFTIANADSVTAGYLSAADWNAFNVKQNSIGTGTTGQFLRGDLAWATPVLTTSLSALTDVTLISLSNGQLLRYNAGAWTNFTPTYVAAGYFSATNPLAYNSSTGVFTISQSTTSANGYLSSTDWNTFNGKQAALGFTPYNSTNPNGYINSSGSCASATNAVNATNATYATSATTAGSLSGFGNPTTAATASTIAYRDSSGTLTAAAFYESSDKRIKLLIEDDYKVIGIEKVSAKLYLKNGIQELGYYAQDVQGLLPSAVSEDKDGFLSLSYREVHTAKITYLENKIAELELKINNVVNK